ncbi:hypothetical protein N7488_007924 [Penicillium malachiteum]|nr:hypothetical protein N7488_007924 [Penicillium malachiteum]
MSMPNSPPGSTGRPTWQDRLSDHCRRNKLAPPVFNIVSDRRGTYPISDFSPAYTFLLPPFVISIP